MHFACTCICSSLFTSIVTSQFKSSTPTQIVHTSRLHTARLFKRTCLTFQSCIVKMPGASGRPRGRPRKTQNAPAATSTTANVTQISAFARVSKQATTLTGKDLADKKAESDDFAPIVPSTRKRRAAHSPEPEQIAAISVAQHKILSATSRSTKKARLQAPEPVARVEEQWLSTPRAKSNKKRSLSPTPEESPRTKEAGNLFKRLRLDASPFPLNAARTSSPLLTNTTASPTRTSTSTPAASLAPDSEDDADADSSNHTTPDPEPHQPLPQELLDILSLYIAFVKTIALHYAHNGTNTPVDLRQISQAVSLAWGKRRISLADVRRCVGVMDLASTPMKSPFYLVDYGAKKVCVELRDEHHGRLLDGDGLVGAFEVNLRRIWSDVKDAAAEDMNTFVLGLPKAPVQSCDSVVKAGPQLSRGHKAAQEIKAAMAAKKDEKKAAEAVKAQAARATTDSDAPKLPLLERLRLKETQLAALAGTGPTAADLERRAALQRAADVAAVVAMLAKSAPSAGTGGRVSFTMVTVLQKLRDSLRLPISKDEGAACVRLLAGEVAPEWLRIVKIGAKENVVVTVARAPSSGMVVERVKTLLAA